MKKILYDNEVIEAAISDYKNDPCEETVQRVMSAIGSRIIADGKYLVPLEILNKEAAKQGNCNLPLRTISFSGGKKAMPVFTTEEEMKKENVTSAVQLNIREHLRLVTEMEEITGIVINPFGNYMILPIGILKMILTANKMIC